MSLLTPVKVPVEVYRWDDVGAPVLDKTAGCMMNIFKSCLVTGYGTKEGAGWTMPFGDATAGVKVLRPEVSPRTDFYLRLSNDTGVEMAAQVYLNMTDVNTGDLKLDLPNTYQYGAMPNSSNRWLLVASTNALWFFTEASSGAPLTKAGMWFFAGGIDAQDGGDCVGLQYSGGTYGQDFHGYINNSGDNANHLDMRLLNGSVVKNTYPISWIDGANKLANFSNNDFIGAYIDIGESMAPLTGMLVPLVGHVYNNFDVVDAVTPKGVQQIVCIGSSTTNAGGGCRFILTEFW